MFESAVLDPKCRVAGLSIRTSRGGSIDAHLAGTGRQGNVLWSLLVLARWAERYLEVVARPR